MDEDYYKKKAGLKDSDIVFSKTVKAGKRVYYLDVKRNKKNELFLVVTESKKVVNEDQTIPASFKKHKIFLYKEDFDKFQEALDETLNFIWKNNTVDFVPNQLNEKTQNPITKEINLRIDF